MRWVAFGTLLLLAAPAAGADILSSRPTFRAGQTTVTCTIVNVGSTLVTVSNPKVAAEVGPTFDLQLAPNECRSTLGPTQNCTWNAATRTGGAHLCRVTVSNKAGLRGQMGIRGSGLLLGATEMR
ncbi:MAG: hypothetical protein U1E45_08980 [Geminicoccaceae bacterium]